MKYRAAIICLSDKGFKGERVDTSSLIIEDILTKNNYQIAKKRLLPDDYQLIVEELKDICDNREVELIITTGGTGFSKRDITPEATLAVVERLTPGIPEAMRYHSLKVTPRAMLSRSVAGIRKDTLIINLPGSSKAAKENLEAIIGSIQHGLEILQGDARDCGTNHLDNPNKK